MEQWKGKWEMQKCPFHLNIKFYDAKPKYDTRLDVKHDKPQEFFVAARPPKKIAERWVEKIYQKALLMRNLAIIIGICMFKSH